LNPLRPVKPPKPPPPAFFIKSSKKASLNPPPLNGLAEP